MTSKGPQCFTTAIKERGSGTWRMSFLWSVSARFLEGEGGDGYFNLVGDLGINTQGSLGENTEKV